MIVVLEHRLMNAWVRYLAADVCLSWWQKRDEDVEIDDMLWEMSEQRINELACDPYMARAYLAGRIAD